MNDAQTNESRPKPLGAEEDPVERARQLARLVASDQPGESAGAMRMLGLHAAKHGFSKRLSETLAAEIPHLTNGGGKTRAELETRIVELERQNEDLFTTNQALGEQNEAIFNENTRLRRPGAGERIAGAMRRLTDIFTPAASGDGSAPRKGFLRNAFAASVPGALAAGALMMGASLKGLSFAGTVVSIASWFLAAMCAEDEVEVGAGAAAVAAGVSGAAAGAIGIAGTTAGIFASAIGFISTPVFAAVLAGAAPRFSPGKIGVGTLTGAALSAALVFGAATYGHAPENTVPEAPEKSAAAATVTPDRAQHQNGSRLSP